MIRYFLTRLIFLILTLWLIVTTLFVVNYFTEVAAWLSDIYSQGGVSVLDASPRPLNQEYGYWISNAIHGKLGWSFGLRAPISELISKNFPYTATLIIMSLLFSVLTTIAIYTVSRRNRNSFVERCLKGFQLIFISVPIFLIGILILDWLFVSFRWYPSIENATIFNDPLMAIQRYLIPTIIMGLVAASFSSRVLRSASLEATGSVHPDNTRPEGMRGWAISYVLPVVSTLGLQVSLLLGFAVIIEWMFLFPGLGTLLMSAVEVKDYIVLANVIACMMILAFGVNFISDILRWLFDPRVRAQAAHGDLVTSTADF